MSLQVASCRLGTGESGCGFVDYRTDLGSAKVEGCTLIGEPKGIRKGCRDSVGSAEKAVIVRTSL
jgi:hypothetical protein